MTNVCVASPIIAFHSGPQVRDEATAASCPDQLRQRERVERAAAKASATLAGRRAHQELAELLYAARKKAEASIGQKSPQND